MLKRFAAAAVGGLLVAGLPTACGGDNNTNNNGGGGGTDKIVMGFAQTGAESAWRTANTTSVKESAAAAGIELKFVDGQGKQENQIAAIRSFIQQGVDVIAFSPLVVTGWDAARESFTLNDGGASRRVSRRADLEKRWRTAGSQALIVREPRP